MITLEQSIIDNIKRVITISKLFTYTKNADKSSLELGHSGHFDHNNQTITITVNQACTISE